MPRRGCCLRREDVQAPRYKSPTILDCSRRWEQVRPHVPGALEWLTSRLYNLTDPGPGSEVHAPHSISLSPTALLCTANKRNETLVRRAGLHVPSCTSMHAVGCCQGVNSIVSA